MNVGELIEWLQEFPDKGATIEVLECKHGEGYYDQGGVTHSTGFDPDKHADYTDLRGNPHIPDDAPYKDSRTLLLGSNDG